MAGDGYICWKVLFVIEVKFGVCIVEEEDLVSDDTVCKGWSDSVFEEVRYNSWYAEGFDEIVKSDVEVTAVCDTDCIEFAREVNDDEFIWDDSVWSSAWNVDNDVGAFEKAGIFVTCDLEETDCASKDAVCKYWLYGEVLYNFEYVEGSSKRRDIVLAFCSIDGTIG